MSLLSFIWQRSMSYVNFALIVNTYWILHFLTVENKTTLLLLFHLTLGWRGEGAIYQTEILYFLKRKKWRQEVPANIFSAILNLVTVTRFQATWDCSGQTQTNRASLAIGKHPLCWGAWLFNCISSFRQCCHRFREVPGGKGLDLPSKSRPKT